MLDAPQPALDEVRPALEKVLAMTMRAGEIIRRIRRFVTRHEIGQEDFAPNQVVDEVEQLFQDEAQRRRIVLATELAPNLPILKGDAVQVQQVLVNLVQNAFESLSSSQVIKPSVVMQTCKVDSGAVEFRVTDNGEGIPGDHLGKIFDAYFSTRADGMGMGLAISRTIVEAHGGRISAESIPRVRTTFRFSLPQPSVSGDDA
jgi:two-component system sensor kinase FixL